MWSWVEIIFWILVVILLIVLFKTSIVAFWIVLVIAIIWLIVRLTSTPKAEAYTSFAPGCDARCYKPRFGDEMNDVLDAELDITGYDNDLEFADLYNLDASTLIPNA